MLSNQHMIIDSCRILLSTGNRTVLVTSPLFLMKSTKIMCRRIYIRILGTLTRKRTKKDDSGDIPTEYFH